MLDENAEHYMSEVREVEGGGEEKGEVEVKVEVEKEGDKEKKKM